MSASKDEYRAEVITLEEAVNRHYTTREKYYKAKRYLQDKSE